MKTVMALCNSGLVGELMGVPLWSSLRQQPDRGSRTRP
ncbi:hypothetical protein I545_6277 [Mycobacterium kansasii 662]|uniref:Uncharacterized protein n=1 Tax=Mycobacterium kansasii 662 TaxID=1299326 RepID=X7YMW8_MYCKA|nr:hypothetical protein I545_6277 [Mycobacterium kansasii 662]